MSDTCPSRTAALADGLVAALPAEAVIVRDVLRWAAPMRAAHCQAGTRDPQELYSALRLTDPHAFDRPGNAVIIDDVLVTGGHIRAVAAFLSDCGANVLCAVCAARAEYVGRMSPFQIRVDSLPAFVPDPDWLLPFSC